jgi:hypothetical protein
MLQAERKASTYSKASAWLIDNDKAIEVRMPLKTEVVMPCGRYLVCHGVRQLWIVDGRSGMVIANMPGSVKGQYHFPGSDIGYMAVNSDMPGWLPVWLRDFYSWYHPEGTGESRIVRVNDGSVSRIIPYRRQPWFDDEGNLWTTNPTAAGGEAIERWSPESPHPWWLYAVAAAGVGYLIWPALVRLTSRWRQTRPAAIAV